MGLSFSFSFTPGHEKRQWNYGIEKAERCKNERCDGQHWSGHPYEVGSLSFGGCSLICVPSVVGTITSTTLSPCDSVNFDNLSLKVLKR